MFNIGKMSPATSASADRIRSKFLHKIGFDGPPSSPPRSPLSPLSPPSPQLVELQVVQSKTATKKAPKESELQTDRGLQCQNQGQAAVFVHHQIQDNTTSHNTSNRCTTFNNNNNNNALTAHQNTATDVHADADANTNAKISDTETASSPSPTSSESRYRPSMSPSTGFLFEPLKICLDSGDDSSLGSSSFCDSDTDYFFGFTEDADREMGIGMGMDMDMDIQEAPPPLAPPPPVQVQVPMQVQVPLSSSTAAAEAAASMDCFHKEQQPPHKADNENTNLDMSLNLTSAPTLTSLPSLLWSSSSDGSTPEIRSTSLSNNNNKALKRKYSATVSSSSSSSNNTSPSSNRNTNTNNNGTNNNNNRRNGKNRGVSLHKSVSVIPIPSRLEYSSVVAERLWSSSAELCANAARNSVEFASEGWNWRNVIEDEGMLLHKASGELIHPIHVQNALTVTTSDSGATSLGMNMENMTEEDRLTLSLISGLVPNTHEHNPKTTISDDVGEGSTAMTMTINSTTTTTTCATEMSTSTPMSSSHPTKMTMSDVASADTSSSLLGVGLVVVGSDPVTVTDSIL